MTPKADDIQFADIQHYWEQSQWADLQALRVQHLEPLDQRETAALYVAAAHFHVSDAANTGVFLRQAMSWGANRPDVINLLLGGVQNTMGRIALLMENSTEAKSHFKASVAPFDTSQNAHKTAFVRQFHEMLDLGLLPEAVATLSDEARTTSAAKTDPAPWATILDSKVEILTGVISQSLQKGQMLLEQPSADQAGDVKAYAQKHSVSQLGQDIWVLEQTDFKRDGFFVEFGATNGILLSNSYVLETAFGWNGICAEPNPHFYAQLEKNRKCTVSPDCIGAKTGEKLQFILADEYGGIANFAADDNHHDKRAAYAQEADNVLDVVTVSLNDFLIKHNAPKTIDYLSIDTEGSEFAILETFPFEDWDISYITVEHNFTPMRDAIFDLLTSKGYVRTEAQWDDWYVKTSSDPA
ncbi:MAG: FkbM family methyltransferase [Yoonia sp.]|jgi:FkbM family methyltransferase